MSEDELLAAARATGWTKIQRSHGYGFCEPDYSWVGIDPAWGPHYGLRYINKRTLNLTEAKTEK